MRTTLVLGLGCALGVVAAGCDRWPDGAEGASGEPGSIGVPGYSDPAGPSPTSRIDAERATDEGREQRARERLGTAETRRSGPAVPPTASNTPTLDVQEAAGAQTAPGTGTSGTVAGTAEATTGGAADLGVR